MSLLDRLVGHAPGQEDAITEVLAWFLRASPLHREGVLRRMETLLRARGGLLPRGADGSIVEPVITTQMTVADPWGGACRYDLVLDWHAPRVRAVIEVKVWAGLTWKDETDPETQERQAAHQITRYLRVAEGAAEMRTFVFLLAPYVVELGLDALPPAFAGQLTWQQVHDVFVAVAPSAALDDTMRLLTRDFVHALETRHMAAPKLTFDGLTSVVRYRRFEQAVRAMLTHSRDVLFADGTLSELAKGDKRAWQDEHDRLGWRVWVKPSQAAYFAFLGIYFRPDTIHEEVPDLYFFLEASRGTAAQEAIDAEGTDIAAKLEALSSPATRWSFQKGGWESICARRSMVEIVRLPDPTDGATQFFRECVRALKANGVYQQFLAASQK